MESEAKSWFASGLPSGERTMPAEHLTRAFEMLDQIHYPTEAEVALIRKALKSSFADVMNKWMGAASADCAGLRLVLVRPLIAESAKDASLRTKFAPRLRQILATPHYPTLLDVTLSLVLLNEGLQKGLWSAEPKLVVTVAKDVADAKKVNKDWQDKFHQVFRDA